MIDIAALARERCRLPHVFVTSWRAPSDDPSWGPNRKLNIMARPQAWSTGAGGVPALAPPGTLLDELRAGRMTFPDYEQTHRALLRHTASELAPGALRVQDGSLVESGDTLCCACAVAAGARRECHRVWAAEELLAAGWRVTLDGVRLRKRCAIFGTSGGYSRLDRAFPTIIRVFDREFASVEHFLAWGRCHDTEPALAEQILKAPNPHQARDMGRACPWSLADEILATLVGMDAYFAQAAGARADLLGTGDARLVAASPQYGLTWGAASAAPGAEGDNLYGELLMCLRALHGGSD